LKRARRIPDLISRKRDDLFYREGHPLRAYSTLT
jgi:hypothetical protein